MIFSLQNCILPRLQVDVLESLRFSNKLLKGEFLKKQGNGIKADSSTHLFGTHKGSSFAAAKAEFNSKHATATLAACIVPVRGKAHPPIAIRSVSGQPIEEYYKWQFINAIVLSGLYPKDYVGVEVHFPTGNKGSAALKLDAAIFDDPAWVDHYNAYWADYTPSHLEWLNEHLIAVVEFKKGDKDRATLISFRSFDKDDEGEHTPP
jgi:type I restriction enzyme M protein